MRINPKDFVTFWLGIIMLIAVLCCLGLVTGCASTTSWRFTGLEINNFTPEKLTASRDADRVVYDRGGSELSEGTIASPPEYEDEDEPSWISDVWTALVSILPDWNVRVTIMKFEYDEVVNPLLDEEEAELYWNDEKFITNMVFVSTNPISAEEEE